jgi:hypothetical protein
MSSKLKSRREVSSKTWKRSVMTDVEVERAYEYITIQAQRMKSETRREFVIVKANPG